MFYKKLQEIANEDTRNFFNEYAPHREKLMAEILKAKSSGRAIILGAGNCNDIDLNELSKTFDQTFLLDIDVTAMELGLQRQKPIYPEKIKILEFDLTGILANIQLVIRDTSLDTLLNALKAVNDNPKLPEGFEQSFDLVVSAGVITQIIYPLKAADFMAGFYSIHDLLEFLRDRLFRQHLKLISRLLKDDGRAIFTVDHPLHDYPPEEAVKWPRLYIRRTSRLYDQLIEESPLEDVVPPTYWHWEIPGNHFLVECHTLKRKIF
ncbi:hypothetical protein [Carboxydothermus ferrireducens]|uniref:SAM-dependent methyltransferase n=1 Tax=Carboxydothermus ferrireducens DSM 11255 TaxID=1119529 RepID=A0ABX2R9Y9_9THEO|nr:hypothetical protein [Carboxydothermus ferrireducens]NYE57992.1 SAM-dependent methyltransferase [Carboxydothermus ferrireducens DSM 11255]